MKDPTDSPDIVIKFVSTYGEGAHDFLWKKGYAPRLRSCGRPHDNDVKSILGQDCHSLSGSPPYLAEESSALRLCSMTMIVMDYVEPISVWPHDALQQIRGTISELHEAGMVFGDLRVPNIIFDKAGKVKFIDFDWAGPYATDQLTSPLNFDKMYAHYPAKVSRNIEWPGGAGDYLPIRPEHDIVTLEKL